MINITKYTCFSNHAMTRKNIVCHLSTGNLYKIIEHHFDIEKYLKKEKDSYNDFYQPIVRYECILIGKACKKSIEKFKNAIIYDTNYLNWFGDVEFIQGENYLEWCY